MRWISLLAWVAASVLLGGATAKAEPAALIELGRAAMPLEGPWRFHTGDDPHFAEPAFDDAAWDSLSLAAPPGAHDDDVGWTGWVPGWNANGHRGYWGYAWYRLRFTVSAPDGTSLALTGPPVVDSAYQIFLDGVLLGGAGRFEPDGPPVILSVQPRLFPVTLAPTADGSHVVAIRAWMGPNGAQAPLAGGIHVAPQLGTAEALGLVHMRQWLESFRGYVVDATEGVLLLLTAGFVLVMLGFEPEQRGWLWMAAGLAALGIGRANQASWAWGQFETAQDFEVVRVILITPLQLGFWVMTWKVWFKVERPAWLAPAVLGLTGLYLLLQLLGRYWLSPPVPGDVLAFARAAAPWVRLGFVLAMAFVLVAGIVGRRGRDVGLALAMALLAAIGTFADELSALHVQGIWFPWGTGVSRTEYAYAALLVAAVALIVTRLMRIARAAASARISAPPSAPAIPPP